MDMHSHMLRHEGLPSKKKTEDSLKVYACHNCDQCFMKGHYLTKHLIRHHGYNQSSAFLRLRLWFKIFCHQFLISF